MIHLTRRRLFRGLLGFAVAPAIVRATSLMPVSTDALVPPNTSPLVINDGRFVWGRLEAAGYAGENLRLTMPSRWTCISFGDGRRPAGEGWVQLKTEELVPGLITVEIPATREKFIFRDPKDVEPGTAIVRHDLLSAYRFPNA